jgi:hypothetical protein
MGGMGIMGRRAVRTVELDSVLIRDSFRLRLAMARQASPHLVAEWLGSGLWQDAVRPGNFRFEISGFQRGMGGSDGA